MSPTARGEAPHPFPTMMSTMDVVRPITRTEVTEVPMPEELYIPHSDALAILAGMDIQFVHCSKCGAQPGDRCSRPGGGTWDFFHSAREQIYGLGFCPRCGANPGEYCTTTTTDRPTPPHAGRLPIGVAAVRPRPRPAPSWPGRMALADRKPGASKKEPGGIGALARRWLRIATLRRAR